MKRTFYALYWGIALFVLVAGSITYYQIFNVYPDDLEKMAHPHSEPELIVRSVFGAINLFLFNIDTDAVVGWMENDPKGSSEAPGIWLHFLAGVAALWTILFVLWIFANASWMNIKRYFHSLFHRQTLFVFWGINERSVRLAKELNGKGEYTLFLVERATDTEEEPDGIDSIVAQGRRRVQLHRAIEGASASIFETEKGVLPKLVRRYVKNSKEVHFLLLGDNEMGNIDTALRISDHRTWGDIDAKITVHCHARRNTSSRSIEHLPGHYRITIVDSSHMAIEMLKKEVQAGIPVYHPVRYVDFSTENPGTVTSAFRSMIIGFSETGQDALAFLYEFGAFMSSSNDLDHDARSPFHCDVVDRHFGPSARRWITHAKGVFESHNEDGSLCIDLHGDTDYRDADFYSRILGPAIDSGLNYVVIALGDDQAGMDLAVDILRYASVHRRVDLTASYPDTPTSDRFTVYVRSYDASKYDYMSRIAAQYAPFIVLFGAEKDMYTRRMLIDEELRTKAMNYFFNYEKTAANDRHESFDPKATPASMWETRREKYSGTLAGRVDLRRRESQDYANALHEQTKRVLFSVGAPELRMAQTEHLRWMAAHEIMGYHLAPERNILRYEHESMIPWNQLSDITKYYDVLTLRNIIPSA